MSSTYKPRRSGDGDGDGDGDNRSRRDTHRPRPRDRREESPRHRTDHYEPRRYRDRRSPDPSRRKKHHQEKTDADNTDTTTTTTTTKDGPPKPPANLYPKSSVQRDNLASSKIRHHLPKKGAPTQQERERARSLPSANELKTKIRDVKRLLRRTNGDGAGGDKKKDLPADLRIEKERALIGYQRDLEEVEEMRKRSDMIRKYHFVRFLERKRATTNLNRALQHQHTLQTSTTTPPTSPTSLTTASTLVHEARVSLNYTIYCPLNQKYISLYPSSHKDKDREKSNEYLDSDPNSLMLRNMSGEKPPLWEVVERCMLEDQREGDGEGRRRLEELRDGKVEIGFGGASAGAGAGASKKGGDGDEDMEEGGMSLAVRKKPGTFGVGNGGMMVGGKKPGSFGVGSASKTEVKKEEKKNNKTGGDVEMGDGDGDGDGEESDGGFFE